MTTDAPTPTPRPRRPRGLIIALAVAVALLAVAVAYILGTQRPNTSGANPPASTSSAPSSPAQMSPTPTTAEVTTTAPATGGLADGCLGGPNPFAAILTARATATPDIAGAAALARTYGRWMVTYPIDTQPTMALASVIGPDTGTLLTQTVDDVNAMARRLQSGGYTEGKALPDDAMYRVQLGPTDDNTVIDQIVSRQLTRSDGRVETEKVFMSVVLSKDETGWAITGTLPPLSADPFAASPTNPWLYYDGVC